MQGVKTSAFEKMEIACGLDRAGCTIYNEGQSVGIRSMGLGTSDQPSQASFSSRCSCALEHSGRAKTDIRCALCQAPEIRCWRSLTRLYVMVFRLIAPYWMYKWRMINEFRLLCQFRVHGLILHSVLVCWNLLLCNFGRSNSRTP